jgi:U3 small nucleolar RNA-associated protein 10
MNVETLIQVFLPYHESQNFPRMLSILSIPPTSVYHAPFQPLIRTAQPVPRSYIVTAISPAKEPSLRLLRDVVGSVHLALQEGVAHRALLAFWSASIIELLESGRNGKGVKEGVVVALVEAFVEILYTPGAGQDVNVCRSMLWSSWNYIADEQAAVYPPLILLTRTIRLADEPFQAILSALLTPGTGAIGTQRILTLLVLLNDRKVWTAGLGDKAAEHLGQVKLLGDTLLAAMGKYGFEDAIGIVIGAMLDRLVSPLRPVNHIAFSSSRGEPCLYCRPDVNAKHLRSVLDHPSLPAPIVKAAALKLISPNQDRFSGSTQPLLAALRERHPVNVDSVILESGAQVNIDATLSGKVATGQAFADVYSADVATRISSIKRVFETFGDDGNAADQASAKEAIRARLSDEDLPVVEAIYSHSDRLGEMYEVREIVQAVRPCFTATTPPAGVFAAHIRYLSVHAAGQEDMVFKQLLFPCLLAADARTPLGAETWAMLAEGALAAVSVIGKIARAVQQMDKAQSQDAVQLNMVVIKAVTGT